MLYEPRDEIKTVINNLFFYCGYATNEQKVPAVDSRIRFNFCQAEIEFKQYAFNEEIAEDIKNKWAEGITFLHKLGSAWDFDQKYENWEVTLMED